MGKNAFMKSVMKAFWRDYVSLMFLNIFVTVLNLCGPYLIKQLIDYVKNGTNAWQIVWVPVTGVFTFDQEYGLLLVALLVVTQGLTYFVGEHILYY